MLHCPPGAAVFELMHSHNFNRQWFVIMAAKLGLEYIAVPSWEKAVEAHEGKLRATAASINAPYGQVNVENLVESMRKVLFRKCKRLPDGSCGDTIRLGQRRVDRGLHPTHGGKKPG